MKSFNNNNNNIRLIKSIPLQILGVCLTATMLINQLINQGPEILHPEIQRAELITFLIYVAVMLAASIVLAPKPKGLKGPKPVSLEQFDIPTAIEGRPIQVLFGKKYVASPNVVWFGHLKTTAVRG